MSEDSEDEPLSILASKKGDFTSPEATPVEAPVKKIKKVKKKKDKKKKEDLKIVLKIPRKNEYHYIKKPELVQPTDVWLYIKDLNPLGPYSCLLCTEWFINKSKLVIHYVLNHKKDYCGICRYFVESRSAWLLHGFYHTPVVCSQCPETFDKPNEQIEHLSEKHNSVHCKFCHFMMPNKEEYTSHLYKKHLVSNIANYNEEFIWEVENQSNMDFNCLLCSKTKLKSIDFFKHYSCVHRFTLRCFSALLSGQDLPFRVHGVSVSVNFLENELKGLTKYGYTNRTVPDAEIAETSNDQGGNESLLLSNLELEIKHENYSDYDEFGKPKTPPLILKEEDENEVVFDEEMLEKLANYTGNLDFDLTLVELITIQKEYIEYIDKIKTAIESNVNPECSKIPFRLSAEEDDKIDFKCPMCSEGIEDISQVVQHMTKTHNIKTVSPYFCRLCLTCFETNPEMERHYQIELAAFQDLWLCQYCDYEFENREAGREHLNEHWQSLSKDNCFSPQLGFKCRFCPQLFWNEPEREEHHYRMHFVKHPAVFYKCTWCEKIFSDKVWFSYHHIVEHTPRELTPSERILYKCTLCCNIRPTVESMREHFAETHSDAKKVYCCLEPCKFRPFSSNKSLKTHVKTCHGPNTKPATAPSKNECTVCSRTFANARAAGAHMAVAHGPGRFKCKICLEMLQSNDERNIHYLIRHPGRHPYECEVCGKSFLYKSTMYMHKSNYHSTEHIVFTCEYCQKEFTRRDSYREHLLIHSGPRHSCSYCPASFAQRSNMLRHERRHTGEKPYHCTHCTKCFADKGACNSHIKMHEQPQSHFCPYCQQRFVQASKLRYHIRKHTGEGLETCPVCSKLFTSPYSLREHMKTHDKTALNCPICNKEVSGSTSLIRHIKKHRTDDNPNKVPCPLCDFLAGDNYLLKKHVVTHSTVKAHKCLLCKKRYCGKKSLKKHIKAEHKIKQNEVNNYISSLNPYKLQLNLDDETMENIFGPKKDIVEVPVNDYVLVGPDQMMTIKPEIDLYENEEQAEDNDRESEEDVKPPLLKKFKMATDGGANGSQPVHVSVTRDDGDQIADDANDDPNFVTIKIERIDEEYGE